MSALPIRTVNATWSLPGFNPNAPYPAYSAVASPLGGFPFDPLRMQFNKDKVFYTAPLPPGTSQEINKPLRDALLLADVEAEITRDSFMSSEIGRSLFLAAAVTAAVVAIRFL